MILEPLVADIADIALYFALTRRVLLRNNAVPRAPVQVVDHVVQLQLVQGQLSWTTGLTQILENKFVKVVKIVDLKKLP